MNKVLHKKLLQERDEARAEAERMRTAVKAALEGALRSLAEMRNYHDDSVYFEFIAKYASDSLVIPFPWDCEK